MILSKSTSQKLLIFFGFLFSFALMPIGGNRVSIIVFSLLAFWLLYDKSLRLTKSTILLYLAPFYIWLIISIIPVVHLEGGLNLTDYFSTFVTSFFVILSFSLSLLILSSKRELIDVAIWAIYISGIILSFGVTIKYGTDLFETRERIRFLFSNPNGFAVALSFSFIGALMLMVRIKLSFWCKVFIIISMLFIVTLILQTGSRKAFLTCLIVLAGYVIHLMRDSSRPKQILFLFGFTIVAINFLAFDYFTESKVYERSFEGSADDSLRAMIYKSVPDILSSKPFFGHGHAQFSELFYLPIYSHSTLVEVVITSGLIGFVFFFIPFISLLIYSLKRFLLVYRSAQHSPFLNLSIILSLLALMLTLIIFLMPNFMIFLALLIADRQNITRTDRL